ncbi:hypothetical protein [Streptomyces sp. 147326]|uniref:hypothetical protein n=1 Tax=Streptomyces sp. 147326 TaxID=3074379 RepID=UPI0038578D3B
MEGLAHAPASMRRVYKRWSFAPILNPAWRLVAKELVLALLVPNHESVAELPHAFRTPIKPNSVYGTLMALTHWLNHLTGQGIVTLEDVRQEHCDAYLEIRRRRMDGTGEIEPSSLASIVRPILYLARYGELFTADAYTSGFFPWDGRPAGQVAGWIQRNAGNVTPPVPDNVFQPMLDSALYIVDTIGPYVAAELRKFLDFAASARAMPQHRSLTGTDRSRILAAIEEYARDGLPFPRLVGNKVSLRVNKGWRRDDPLLTVNTQRFAQMVIGVRNFNARDLAMLRPAWEAAVAAVGVGGDCGLRAELVPRHDEPSVKIPWTLPLEGSELRALSKVVLSACLLVTAAISGMRASELEELDSSSCLPPTETIGGGVRHRLGSRLIKGRKFGGTPEEWVVIEEPYRAVQLAIRFSDPNSNSALFGGETLDVGKAYTGFREWVNGPAGQRLGLPIIPAGPVNARMLRRTLALALAHRPMGLLAAKIHLKHVSVATTEGYAHLPGGSQGVFLEEVREAEEEHHVELTREAFRDFQKGVMPAGPGASGLIAAFTHIDAELREHEAGEAKVLDSDRRLENLLQREAKNLHVGVANYCWNRDPDKMLCWKLAGTTPKADSKPMVGMCDSARCSQATHHPCHREVWQSSHDSQKVFLRTIGRNKVAKAALQADVDRSRRVLEEIDAAALTASARDGQ